MDQQSVPPMSMTSGLLAHIPPYSRPFQGRDSQSRGNSKSDVDVQLDLFLLPPITAPRAMSMEVANPDSMPKTLFMRTARMWLTELERAASDQTTFSTDFPKLQIVYEQLYPRALTMRALIPDVFFLFDDLFANTMLLSPNEDNELFASVNEVLASLKTLAPANTSINPENVETTDKPLAPIDASHPVKAGAASNSSPHPASVPKTAKPSDGPLDVIHVQRKLRSSHLKSVESEPGNAQKQEKVHKRKSDELDKEEEEEGSEESSGEVEVVGSSNRVRPKVRDDEDTKNTFPGELNPNPCDSCVSREIECLTWNGAGAGSACYRCRKGKCACSLATPKVNSKVNSKATPKARAPRKRSKAKSKQTSVDEKKVQFMDVDFDEYAPDVLGPEAERAEDFAKLIADIKEMDRKRDAQEKLMTRKLLTVWEKFNKSESTYYAEMHGLFQYMERQAEQQSKLMGLVETLVLRLCPEPLGPSVSSSIQLTEAAHVEKEGAQEDAMVTALEIEEVQSHELDDKMGDDELELGSADDKEEAASNSANPIKWVFNPGTQDRAFGSPSASKKPRFS